MYPIAIRSAAAADKLANNAALWRYSSDTAAVLLTVGCGKKGRSEIVFWGHGWGLAGCVRRNWGAGVNGEQFFHLSPQCQGCLKIGNRQRHQFGEIIL